MRNTIKITILMIVVSLSSCSVLHLKDRYYIDEDYSEWYETDGVISVSDLLSPPKEKIN